MKQYKEERDKRILEFVSPKKEDKILIIGTGIDPRMEEYLSDHGCSVTSLDIDQDNIIKAEDKLPGVRFICADAQVPLPFYNNEFDKVLLIEVLEHLVNENIILSEIRRVLKPDGTFIMSVPKIRWFKVIHPITRWQHEREYEEHNLEALLLINGFKIADKFVGGNAYELLNIYCHLFYKYILKRQHNELFFKYQINKAYLKSYKGIGTDIILKLNKTNN